MIHSTFTFMTIFTKVTKMAKKIKAGFAMAVDTSVQG